MLTERNDWVGLYESFAAGRFGGNVAGVVISADELDDPEMQGIASVLNAPTTGFVHAPTAHFLEVTVRFFTPSQEIDACGHVTIATVQALYHNDLRPSTGETVVACKGGRFPISFNDGLLTMSQRVRHEPEPFSRSEQEIHDLLGVEVVGASFAGTGLRHLFAEVGLVSDLARLRLDHADLMRFGRRHAVDTIGVFARVDHQRVRLRDLTAPIGVTEEPASGTTAGALGLLLGEPSIVVEQGYEMGRPSHLFVETDNERILVRGTAERVMSGTLDAR